MTRGEAIVLGAVALVVLIVVGTGLIRPASWSAPACVPGADSVESPGAGCAGGGAGN